MGVREKCSLRHIVGRRSIRNTDSYLCKFSVPRGGVEKQKTINRKTETQTKVRMAQSTNIVLRPLPPKPGLRYERGRVFLAVVGLDSPSRDASTGCCLRNPTRLLRRGGGLVGRGWCSPGTPFSAPIWCPSGGGDTREAGGTVAESVLVHCSTHKRTLAGSIRQVSTRFGEGGEQLDR